MMVLESYNVETSAGITIERDYSLIILAIMGGISPPLTLNELNSRRKDKHLQWILDSNLFLKSVCMCVPDHQCVKYVQIMRWWCSKIVQ